MQVTPTTPMGDFKFKGFAVKAPQPFTTGHTLTENEAKFVNRQLASVTGNILSSALTRLLAKRQEEENAKAKAENRAPATLELDKAITADEARKLYDGIIAEYEPGVTAARGEGISKDPVETMADNIAWARIKVALGKKNIKVSSVNAEKKAAFIKQLREKDPSILDQAKAAFGNADSPTDAMDDMFASLTAAPSTEPGQAGDDTLSGASGDDSLNGGGDTSVTGGNGDDTVTAPVTPEPVEGNDAGPGVDNPGTTEVAPDASVGEATPSGGAFS